MKSDLRHHETATETGFILIIHENQRCTQKRSFFYQIK